MYKRIEDAIRTIDKSYFLFFDHHAGEMTYGIVMDVEGNNEKHTCAYLNVDKAAYLTQVDDAWINEWDITFDNVPSADISIPNTVKSQLPVAEKNYWIGIDSMGMGIRLHESMAYRLDSIFNDYNRRVGELDSNQGN